MPGKSFLRGHLLFLWRSMDESLSVPESCALRWRFCRLCVNDISSSGSDSVCESYCPFNDLVECKCHLTWRPLRFAWRIFDRRRRDVNLWGSSFPKSDQLGGSSIISPCTSLSAQVPSLTLLRILYSCPQWCCPFCVAQSLPLGPKCA